MSVAWNQRKKGLSIIQGMITKYLCRVTKWACPILFSAAAIFFSIPAKRFLSFLIWDCRLLLYSALLPRFAPFIKYRLIVLSPKEENILKSSDPCPMQPAEETNKPADETGALPCFQVRKVIISVRNLLPCRSTAAPHTCGNPDGGEVRPVKFTDTQHKEKGANQNGNSQSHQRCDDKSANGERHTLFNQFFCGQRVGPQSDIPEIR